MGLAAVGCGLRTFFYRASMAGGFGSPLSQRAARAKQLQPWKQGPAGPTAGLTQSTDVLSMYNFNRMFVSISSACTPQCLPWYTRCRACRRVDIVQASPNHDLAAAGWRHCARRNSTPTLALILTTASPPETKRTDGILWPVDGMTQPPPQSRIDASQARSIHPITPLPDIKGSLQPAGRGG
jgi:hypothetical protein